MDATKHHECRRSAETRPYHEWDAVYAAGIQPLIDAEAKYGYIARSFPASEIVDPDVLSK